MSKFDIFEYIGKYMDNKIKLEEKYEVSLDIDGNDEPYLDIRYYNDGNGEFRFSGLITGAETLEAIIDKMIELKDAFTIHKKPVITVLYNNNNRAYEIECGREKEINCLDDGRFVVGYIIDPKASLSFDEKINHLYEVMVDSIDARGFATVSGIELKNPIFKKNCFNQVEELSSNECDYVNQENIELINRTLKSKMGPQKTKK